VGWTQAAPDNVQWQAAYSVPEFLKQGDS